MDSVLARAAVDTALDLTTRLEEAQKTILALQANAAHMYADAIRRGDATSARGFDYLASLAEDALEKF